MSKTYVNTSAQACARVNKQVLQSILTYLKHNDAEMKILPMQGKHINEDKMAKVLHQYDLVYGDLNLNNKIKIKDYKVKPQAIIPLTGLEPLIKGDRSAIIAGTKINLRAVANSNTRMAKLLMTTGALTHPRYEQRHRIGKIAQMDHEYGMVVVEVINNKTYHARYVEIQKNGKFYDLGTLYDGNTVIENQRVNSLVIEPHVTCIDHKSLEATLKMMKDLKPNNLFIHDMFNGSSISHHNMNDIVELHHYFGENKLSLENELKENAEFLKLMLNKMPSDGKIYIVASNHNEFIDRYLGSGRFINEPQNLEIACDLLKSAFRGVPPLKEGLSYFMDIPDNVIFLNRGEDLRILGYYMNNHGDKGPNGARGSPRGYDKNLEKSISGHGHTCYKYRHTIKIGTIAQLHQRYNMGGQSNWSSTNGILHPNGKTQLINLVNGFYKGE